MEVPLQKRPDAVPPVIPLRRKLTARKSTHDSLSTTVSRMLNTNQSSSIGSSNNNNRGSINNNNQVHYNSAEGLLASLNNRPKPIIAATTASTTTTITSTTASIVTNKICPDISEVITTNGHQSPPLTNSPRMSELHQPRAKKGFTARNTTSPLIAKSACLSDGTPSSIVAAYPLKPSTVTTSGGGVPSRNFLVDTRNDLISRLLSSSNSSDDSSHESSPIVHQHNARPETARRAGAVTRSSNCETSSLSSKNMSNDVPPIVVHADQLHSNELCDQKVALNTASSVISRQQRAKKTFPGSALSAAIKKPESGVDSVEYKRNPRSILRSPSTRSLTSLSSGYGTVDLALVINQKCLKKKLNVESVTSPSSTTDPGGKRSNSVSPTKSLPRIRPLTRSLANAPVNLADELKVPVVKISKPTKQCFISEEVKKELCAEHGYGNSQEQCSICVADLLAKTHKIETAIANPTSTESDLTKIATEQLLQPEQNQSTDNCTCSQLIKGRNNRSARRCVSCQTSNVNLGMSESLSHQIHVVAAGGSDVEMPPLLSPSMTDLSGDMDGRESSQSPEMPVLYPANVEDALPPSNDLGTEQPLTTNTSCLAPTMDAFGFITPMASDTLQQNTGDGASVATSPVHSTCTSPLDSSENNSKISPLSAATDDETSPNTRRRLHRKEPHFQGKYAFMVGKRVKISGDQQQLPTSPPPPDQSVHIPFRLCVSRRLLSRHHRRGPGRPQRINSQSVLVSDDQSMKDIYPHVDIIDGKEFYSFESEADLRKFMQRYPSRTLDVEHELASLAALEKVGTVTAALLADTDLPLTADITTTVERMEAVMPPVPIAGNIAEESSLTELGSGRRHPGDPIWPTKTLDVTKIKGWRGKVFAEDALVASRVAGEVWTGVTSDQSWLAFASPNQRGSCTSSLDHDGDWSSDETGENSSDTLAEDDSAVESVTGGDCAATELLAEKVHDANSLSDEDSSDESLAKESNLSDSPTEGDESACLVAKENAATEFAIEKSFTTELDAEKCSAIVSLAGDEDSSSSACGENGVADLPCALDAVNQHDQASSDGNSATNVTSRLASEDGEYESAPIDGAAAGLEEVDGGGWIDISDACVIDFPLMPSPEDFSLEPTPTELELAAVATDENNGTMEKSISPEIRSPMNPNTSVSGTILANELDTKSKSLGTTSQTSKANTTVRVNYTVTSSPTSKVTGNKSAFVSDSLDAFLRTNLELRTTSLTMTADKDGQIIDTKVVWPEADACPRTMLAPNDTTVVASGTARVAPIKLTKTGAAKWGRGQISKPLQTTDKHSRLAELLLEGSSGDQGAKGVKRKLYECASEQSNNKRANVTSPPLKPKKPLPRYDERKKFVSKGADGTVAASIVPMSLTLIDAEFAASALVSREVWSKSLTLPTPYELARLCQPPKSNENTAQACIARGRACQEFSKIISPYMALTSASAVVDLSMLDASGNEIKTLVDADDFIADDFTPTDEALATEDVGNMLPGDAEYPISSSSSARYQCGEIDYLVDEDCLVVESSSLTGASGRIPSPLPDLPAKGDEYFTPNKEDDTEEKYPPLPELTYPGNAVCGQEFCFFGCLCTCLKVRRRKRTHCNKVQCMFACTCFGGLPDEDDDGRSERSDRAGGGNGGGDDCADGNHVGDPTDLASNTRKRRRQTRLPAKLKDSAYRYGLGKHEMRKFVAVSASARGSGCRGRRPNLWNPHSQISQPQSPPPRSFYATGAKMGLPRPSIVARGHYDTQQPTAAMSSSHIQDPVPVQRSKHQRGRPSKAQLMRSHATVNFNGRQQDAPGPNRSLCANWEANMRYFANRDGSVVPYVVVPINMAGNSQATESRPPTPPRPPKRTARKSFHNSSNSFLPTFDAPGDLKEDDEEKPDPDELVVRDIVEDMVVQVVFDLDFERHLREMRTGSSSSGARVVRRGEHHRLPSILRRRGATSMPASKVESESGFDSDGQVAIKTTTITASSTSSATLAITATSSTINPPKSDAAVAIGRCGPIPRQLVSNIAQKLTPSVNSMPPPPTLGKETVYDMPPPHTFEQTFRSSPRTAVLHDKRFLTSTNSYDRRFLASSSTLQRVKNDDDCVVASSVTDVPLSSSPSSSPTNAGQINLPPRAFVKKSAADTSISNNRLSDPATGSNNSNVAFKALSSSKQQKAMWHDGANAPAASTSLRHNRREGRQSQHHLRHHRHHRHRHRQHDKSKKKEKQRAHRVATKTSSGVSSYAEVGRPLTEKASAIEREERRIMHKNSEAERRRDLHTRFKELAGTVTQTTDLLDMTRIGLSGPLYSKQNILVKALKVVTHLQQMQADLASTRKALINDTRNKFAHYTKLVKSLPPSMRRTVLDAYFKKLKGHLLLDGNDAMECTKLTTVLDGQADFTKLQEYFDSLLSLPVENEALPAKREKLPEPSKISSISSSSRSSSSSSSSGEEDTDEVKLLSTRVSSPNASQRLTSSTSSSASSSSENLLDGSSSSDSSSEDDQPAMVNADDTAISHGEPKTSILSAHSYCRPLQTGFVDGVGKQPLPNENMFRAHFGDTAMSGCDSEDDGYDDPSVLVSAELSDGYDSMPGPTFSEELRDALPTTCDNSTTFNDQVENSVDAAKIELDNHVDDGTTDAPLIESEHHAFGELNSVSQVVCPPPIIAGGTVFKFTPTGIERLSGPDVVRPIVLQIRRNSADDLSKEKTIAIKSVPVKWVAGRGPEKVRKPAVGSVSTTMTTSSSSAVVVKVLPNVQASKAQQDSSLLSLLTNEIRSNIPGPATSGHSKVISVPSKVLPNTLSSTPNPTTSTGVVSVKKVSTIAAETSQPSSATNPPLIGLIPFRNGAKFTVRGGQHLFLVKPSSMPGAVSGGGGVGHVQTSGPIFRLMTPASGADKPVVGLSGTNVGTAVALASSLSGSLRNQSGSTSTAGPVNAQTHPASAVTTKDTETSIAFPNSQLFPDVKKGPLS